MKERVPAPDPTKDLSSPPQPVVDLETYVVQIPRDQICRVPPPEHARIVERYLKRGSDNSATTCRKTLCWATSALIVVIAAAVIAVLGIRATLYNPTPPEFAVASIQGRNLENASKSRIRREIDVTVRAENRNRRLSVSYQGGLGDASLVYKNHTIGQGKIRSTIDQEPGGGTIDITMVLVGNGAAFLPEVEKSLINGSTEKSMALKIEMVTEMNSWVRNERKIVKISCDFKVKNSLMSKNKISFQECRTEF